MGRVKTIPTPRGDMLGDYIAKAHTPKLTPPTDEVRPSHRTVGESITVRTQVVKLPKSASSTSLLGDHRPPLVLSNKRKVNIAAITPKSIRINGTKSLTLRSSKSTRHDNSDAAVVSVTTQEARSNKRQKTEEPLRRTSRLRKPTSDVHSAIAKPALGGSRDKSPPSVRPQRKTAARRARDDEHARIQKEAIDLLQGPQINGADAELLPAPPAGLVPDVGAVKNSGRNQVVQSSVRPPLSPRSSYHGPASQVGNSYDQSDKEIQLESPESEADNYATLEPAASLHDQNFTYRKPSTQETDMPNGKEHDRTGGGDNNSSSSPDSGYVTAPAQHYSPYGPSHISQPHGLPHHQGYYPHPPQKYPPFQSGHPYSYHPQEYYPPQSTNPVQASSYPPYAPPGTYSALMLPVASSTNGWSQHVPAPWPSRDMETHTFIAHTNRGRKVKGKPSQQGPRLTPGSLNQRGPRNVANTYPRKQAFRAQIYFEGYPLEDVPLRGDATLWEICQDFPNHLIGDTLKAFVQKEWSANELFACLKDDVREILKGRPGKDKTMVFQKRLERIKKDSIAQGEYDDLIKGPDLRVDGRPSWVKRGNVRRK